MTRYLRLYLNFLRFSFSKALEFRLDFTFRILMDIMFYVTNILMFKVLFLHTDLIAGWNEGQMMIFISGYLLVDALHMTIFSTNMWWLPFYINRGDLDYYLIRPVSPLFFLSLREFAANSFVNLLIAGGFFVYSLATYPMEWTALRAAAFLILIFNGTLIYYCIQMLMVLPVFWTQSSRGFQDLFHTVGMAMERPDRIFKGGIRVLFTVILPFALISSFPARIFIEGFDLNILTHLALVSIGLWIAVLIVWKKGLKSYSSASS